MAMTDDPSALTGQAARPAAPPPATNPPDASPPETEAEPTLSWAEREMLDGLRRLARARAQLAAAEGRTAEARPRPFDPEAVAELERIHGELVAARAKASGRFGKGGARQQVRDLELAERQVLDHLKMATYEDYQARAAALPASAVVDPDVVAFAQRELEAAERGWQEVRALDLPPAEAPTEPASPEPRAEPEIDLTSRSTLGGSGVA
jgi:hypothetical protein